MPTLKQLVNKIRIGAFAVMMALLFTTSAAIAVRASDIYCLQNCSGQYGETFWLSCGSSAGNYFALCPADGGPCTISDERTQPEADYECEQRGH